MESGVNYRYLLSMNWNAKDGHRALVHLWPIQYIADKCLTIGCHGWWGGPDYSIC